MVFKAAGYLIMYDQARKPLAHEILEIGGFVAFTKWLIANLRQLVTLISTAEQLARRNYACFATDPQHSVFPVLRLNICRVTSFVSTLCIF